jgi:ABC-2 type transport system permease protein
LGSAHIAPVSPGYWAVAALHASLRGDAAATFSAAAVLCGFALAFGLVAGLQASRGRVRSATL